MKKKEGLATGYIRVTTALIIIAITVLFSGCQEFGNPGASQPTPVPAVQSTPTQVANPANMSVVRSGPSCLLNMTDMAWYQYHVALQLNGSPRLARLNVEYSDQSPYCRWVREIWLRDGLRDGNESGFRIYENRSNGTILDAATTGGQMNGQVFDSISLRGLSQEQLAGYRKHDVSTRFNAETDAAMNFSCYEGIVYHHVLYNCSVYEVEVENDTFRLWHNDSLPLPLKIQANYDEPGSYFSHPSHDNVSGPCVYELTGWGGAGEANPVYMRVFDE